jgi:acid stress chaperone HdeB
LASILYRPTLASAFAAQLPGLRNRKLTSAPTRSRLAPRHEQRKRYMKTFAALLVGCWFLSGIAARAETIDFSTTTCKQFLESHKNEIGIILAWLDGYYREEDDPPIFDTEKFEANAKKLAGYCAANPNVGLITATDKLFGK